MLTVRIYGYDFATRRSGLLEERKFTDRDEGKKFADEYPLGDGITRVEWVYDRYGDLTSSGPSLVELDAYGDFAPERRDHERS